MEKYKVTVDGHTYEVEIEKEGSYAPVSTPVIRPIATQVATPAPVATPKATPVAASGAGILAPIQGKVIEVKVAVGQVVAAGDIVVILEAMKMENEIVAETSGTVSGIQISVGDAVEAGAVLISL